MSTAAQHDERDEVVDVAEAVAHAHGELDLAVHISLIVVKEVRRG